MRSGKLDNRVELHINGLCSNKVGSMKILVTGGAGFIGSHLCRALLDQGYYVFCADNLVTGSLENIKDFSNRFLFLPGDIEKLPNLNYDRIYHLASPTSPDAVNQNKTMTRRVNSEGTEYLLRMGSRLLFVSSVKVLGECTRVWDYICGKKEGEKICRQYGARVARLASVYGPGMAIDDSRVIPVFIMNALRNETISLWNGGTQIDSFCYVSDIVDGIIALMESKEWLEPIEFGAPQGISIVDLSRMILDITDGKNVPIRTDESILVVDECHKVVDITKAKNLLGWKPKIQLREGLEHTVDYYRHILKS
jgi:nucleoside-diphosphate-sugar epimerase